MKKVFALIEKKSAKFAQLPLFEFLINKSIAFIQRLYFAAYFAVFVIKYGDFNKFVCLEEATVNPIQYSGYRLGTVQDSARFRGTAVPRLYGCISSKLEPLYIFNKQICEEKNYLMWLLKDFKYLAFNLFLNFTDSLTTICRQIIYELYHRTFQVNPIYRARQEKNCPLPPACVNKIFELFTALVDMLVNLAEEYKIKQLLIGSFDGFDFAQLPCRKKVTVWV
ncbi:MAG: hypothetical protein V7L20_14575 [Nostoc sp.]|uniref:hypothetical protein n=1 Tax=Nostoc sp. TaxID=1180 RepID=UPI002FF470BB